MMDQQKTTTIPQPLLLESP
jgi:hypothetical protein